jgi:hypothetical protein
MYPDMTDEEFTRRILHIVRVGTSQVIPSYVARTASFTTQEHMGSNMLLGLTANVLRDHIVHEVQTVTLEVPATWWQHFKAEHSNGFIIRRFTKRFPIRWETWTRDVTFDRYYDYPDASIQLPEDQFGRFVVYENSTQTDWKLP